MEYYYNVTTKQVEVGKESPYYERLGPFDTHEEAERALEIVAERNKKWDEEDEWASPDDWSDDEGGQNS